jgi:AcrR family transcriptional regulator
MREASPLRLETPHPTPRKQAERRAKTRARLLAAAIESIDEIGFQRTTAAEISRRSGVTWGAVQHHFGGKDGILAAVLEESFNRFAVLLTSAIADEASIEARIDAFIDRAWSHFSSPHYRSTFEILLHAVAPGDDAAPTWQREMIAAWNQVWRQLFPDVKLDQSRTVMLQHYTISVLSGLASMQVLGGRSRFTQQELALLKRTLASEFAKAER